MHFYTPIINYQKGKLRKQSHLQLNLEHKIPRNKFNQGGKRPAPKKKIKQDTNKWKHTLCSWIGKLALLKYNVKMSVLPKAIYRFSAIPIKNTTGICHRTRTNNPKMYVEPQKTHKDTAILRKENKIGGIVLP